MRFAYMEYKLALVSILQQYQVLLPHGGDRGSGKSRIPSTALSTGTIPSPSTKSDQLRSLKVASHYFLSLGALSWAQLGEGVGAVLL